MQKILPLASNKSYTFNNLFVGNNLELVEQLKTVTLAKKSQFFYVWGAPGIGKTHLLRATVQATKDRNEQAYYEIIQPFLSHNFATLEKIIAAHDLIAIDDIEWLQADKEQQENFLHFYNLALAAERVLIVSANCPPSQLKLSLADLHSRLSWGYVYPIKPLNDEEKGELLSNEAKMRGFELNEEVTQFLINRVSRDLRALMRLLDELDQATLIHHRRLTIPFVKDILKL